MKLVYFSALTVAAVYGTKFQVNVDNVRHMNAMLEDVFDQSMEKSFNAHKSKVDQFNGFLGSVVQDINIDEYNESAEQCRVQSASFWAECRQCTAQQCTAFYHEQCDDDFPNNPAAANLVHNRLPSSNPNVVGIKDFLTLLTQHGVQAEVHADNKGSKISMSVEEYLAHIARNDIRRRRSAAECLQGDIEIQSSNAITVGSSDVKCSDNANPAPASLNSALEHSVDISENGWNILGQSTNKFKLQTSVDSQGRTIVQIDILNELPEFADLPPVDGNGSGMEFAYDSSALENGDQIRRVVDYDYGSLESTGEFVGYSNGCANPAGCENMGGNTHFEEESLFMGDEAMPINCDGINDSAECVGSQLSSSLTDEDMPKEKPCTDEEAGFVEDDAIIDPENVGRMDMSDEEFCRSIGKDENCMYEVPFRRRSSHFKRSASDCELVDAAPARCFNLNLQCDNCNQQIRDLCPAYYALRSELSSQIHEASTLSEQFSNSINKNIEEMKWYIAVNNAEGPRVYVQQAKYDADTEEAVLVIKTGNASQASALLRAKVKSDSTFEEFEGLIGKIFQEQDVLGLMARNY